MMHGLLEILDQIKQSSSPHGQGFDLLSGIFPTIKAIQAAVTLGTGCSLGPEGPSVDIGKSCANGFSLMMENNRERKIALVAAGAAAGISSGIQNFSHFSFQRILVRNIELMDMFICSKIKGLVKRVSRFLHKCSVK